MSSVRPEYHTLERVYLQAIEQAAEGKGAERHAEVGQLWEEQRISNNSREFGLGFPLGQADKKLHEGNRFYKQGDDEAAIREWLGLMNYAATAIMILQEKQTGCDEHG